MRCDDPPPVPSHGFRFALHRPIRAPLERTFEWWTDFDEKDASLTDAGRLASRQVLKRLGDTVWKRDINTFAGIRVAVDSMVRLTPPKAWTIMAESRLHGIRGSYRLTPEPWGCRLSGQWHVFARVPWMRPVLAFTKHEHERRLADEWDDYIRHLESEVRAAEP